MRRKVLRRLSCFLLVTLLLCSCTGKSNPSDSIVIISAAPVDSIEPTEQPVTDSPHL